MRSATFASLLTIYACLFLATGGQSLAQDHQTITLDKETAEKLQKSLDSEKLIKSIPKHETRTDIAPTVEVQKEEKDDLCKYVPTQKDLEEQAENIDNLRGIDERMGAAGIVAKGSFLARQKKLNEQWDAKAKQAEEACKTAPATPYPNVIGPLLESDRTAEDAKQDEKAGTGAKKR